MLMIKRGTARRLGLRTPRGNARTPGWATCRELQVIDNWHNVILCRRKLPRDWWTGEHRDVPTYCTKLRGHDPVPHCSGDRSNPHWNHGHAPMCGRTVQLLNREPYRCVMHPGHAPSPWCSGGGDELIDVTPIDQPPGSVTIPGLTDLGVTVTQAGENMGAHLRQGWGENLRHEMLRASSPNTAADTVSPFIPTHDTSLAQPNYLSTRAWCGRQLPEAYWTTHENKAYPTYCARKNGHAPTPWCPGRAVSTSHDRPTPPIGLGGAGR